MLTLLKYDSELKYYPIKKLTEDKNLNAIDFKSNLYYNIFVVIQMTYNPKHI